VESVYSAIEISDDEKAVLSRLRLENTGFASRFIDNVLESGEEHADELFEDKIELYEIENTLSQHNLSLTDITSIHIWIHWNPEIELVDSIVEIKDKNNHSYEIDQEIYMNFDEGEREEIDRITNLELFYCFSEELIQYLLKHSEIDVYFSEEKIDLNILTDSESDVEYETKMP
jgi:hypothetical protein